MKIKTILLVIVFILPTLRLSSQDFIVTVSDRNQTINLTNKATSQIQGGDYINALNNLYIAISIDSTFRPAYVNIFTAAVSAQLHNDTIVDILLKANRIFREDDELQYYLGEIFRANGDYPTAIAYYSNAISYSKINGEDFPLTPYYYINRGVCLMKTNRFDSATADLEHALSLDPELSIVPYNLGICYYKLDRKIDACNEWQKAFDLGHKYASSYLDKYCKN